MSQLQHIEQLLSFTLETKNLAVLEFIERPSYIIVVTYFLVMLCFFVLYFRLKAMSF